MNYYAAEKIRKTNFMQRWQDKQRIQHEGLGSAFMQTAKEGVAARFKMMSRVVDPMFMLKAVPLFGKNLSLAYGVKRGRSQADLNYFSGVKNKNKTASRISMLPQMMEPSKGESLGVLTDMLNFMKTSREEDKRALEIKHNFDEERSSEEQRRHEELLGAITSLVGGKTATQITPTPKAGVSGGLVSDILSTVSSMISTVVSSISGMVKMAIAGLELMVKGLLKNALSSLDWILGLKKYILPLIDFIRSPIFRAIFMNPALLGVTSLAALLALGMKEKEEIEKDYMNEKYNDNPYAMQLRGEAESVGQAGEINRAKAVKQIPRNQIVELVSRKDLTDSDLIYATGENREALDKWLKENPKAVMYQGRVAPIANKPETAVPAGGRTNTAVTASQSEEPSTFETILDKIMPNNSWADKIVPNIPDVGNMLDDFTNRHREMLMDEDTPGAESNVVTMNNTSTKTQDTPATMTASHRDDTHILNRTLESNKAKAH